MDKDKEQYVERVSDYLHTFTSEEGKRVLKDMRRSYCSGSFHKDPYQTAFNLGQEQVIKGIEALLTIAKRPEIIDSLFAKPEDDNFEW